ncbi:MAG: Gldg family protein [Anaerolineae bacterium]|jgi:ABC-type uncharacterized transport system involved in gliding motility auxiliary subunit|uniref:Gldg family protein n=1 Tax=Candidatus Flexifilum breve TaxID=3140694 RepID=UPI001AD4EF1A|nr:Gldg family protein [Chloroflexota bacterium]MBN8634520.1 Gldg family protein [Anaerolineae bacterium]
MTQQTPNVTPENEQPIIPSWIFPLIIVAGLILAAFNASQPGGMTVVGYAGVGFAILAFVAWVLTAPQQVTGLFTGRTARFGGVSIIVTLLVIVLMVGVYALVRGQEWRVDLTESDQFSLTEESSDAIANIGNDPTIPNIRINAFVTAAQAALQDRYAPLFDDYQTTSNGKITYEFVDPERNPTTADAYGVTRSGQVVVTVLDEAGSPDIDNAEVVASVNQSDLTNAILKAAAQGDFRAYILPVEGGVADQMTIIQQIFTEQWDWTVTTDQTLVQLSTSTTTPLNDPNADAEVVIIPGGMAPLTDQELTILGNFLTNGGSLIVFADPAINEDGISLATSENLNTYLRDNFGLSFANDIVLDQTNQVESPLTPYAADFDATSYLTTNGIPAGRGLLAMNAPVSIVVADTAPANVTVLPLVRTATTSYAKTNLVALYTAATQNNGLTPEDIAQAEGDQAGPFVVAASAENVQTGSRVVLFSSTWIGSDIGYQLRNFATNFTVAINGAVWTTHFDEFFNQINIVQQARPQDQPISADVGTLNNLRILTVFVVPFGILLLGVWVWWNNREKAR